MKKVLLLLAVIALATVVSANLLDELEERIVEDQIQDLEDRNAEDDDSLEFELYRARRNKDYLTAKKYT